MNLSGSLTRQAQQEMAVVDDSTQVANVGKMVEEMELKMRNLLRKPFNTFCKRLRQHLLTHNLQKKSTSEKVGTTGWLAMKGIC